MPLCAREYCRLPVARSHTCAVRSSLAVTRRRLSGLNATWLMGALLWANNPTSLGHSRSTEAIRIRWHSSRSALPASRRRASVKESNEPKRSPSLRRRVPFSTCKRTRLRAAVCFCRMVS